MDVVVCHLPGQRHSVVEPGTLEVDKVHDCGSRNQQLMNGFIGIEK